MLNKIILFVIIALFSIVIAGCSHVDIQKNLSGQRLTTDKKYKSVSSISAYNYGYYLFGTIPLVSGSLETEYLTMFNDNVNVKSLTGVIVKQAKDQKADKLLDMTSKVKSFPIIYFLFLVSLNEANVSGDAVEYAK